MDWVLLSYPCSGWAREAQSGPAVCWGWLPPLPSSVSPTPGSMLGGWGGCQAQATHVGLGAEEVEAILVDSKDAGGWHRGIAAALDEEEGGTEHG